MDSTVKDMGPSCDIVGFGIKKCPRCGGVHEFHFPHSLPAESTAYVPCPNVTRLYRLAGFYIDTTPNVLQDELIKARVEDIHGANDLEKKLERWHAVRRAGFWLLHEYRDMVEEVAQAYIQGLNYPALTGACCLAERVMNRLVFSLRPHYKKSAHYKKIHRKERLQSWDDLRRILRDWKITGPEQSAGIKRLYALRTDAVHYVADYDYESAAAEAIQLTLQLLDWFFFVYDMDRIFRIFEIPGEIWVRADKQSDPFVIEFVLPHCLKAGATLTYLSEGGYKEDGAVVGEMTEAEFIETRKAYLKKPEDFDDGKTPQQYRIEHRGERRTFIVP
jgi:hypothetical protein